MAQKTSAVMQMVLDMRKQGKSWSAIAGTFGKDADEIYAEYQEFMSQRNVYSESEYRMVQLERLEAMVDALWDGMQGGSPEHVQRMLPVIQEISKLLDMNKAKTKIEVSVVESKQVELIVNYVDAVTETIYNEVLSTVTAKRQRELIQDNWQDWVAQASAQPLRQLETASVEV